jgi:hypothetical protein
MSILGLTIDYGPFGWMDRWAPGGRAGRSGCGRPGPGGGGEEEGRARGEGAGLSTAPHPATNPWRRPPNPQPPPLKHRYDPHHVCNGSDDAGRYDYGAQPEICRWNCEMLAAALGGGLLPPAKARLGLGQFDAEFER